MFKVQIDLGFGKLMRDVKREEASRLARAAYALRADAMASLDTPNPGGKKSWKGSAPGTPPYKRTGKLQRSIAYKVNRDAMTADVGTINRPASFFGNFLEWGNSSLHTPVAARPFMRPALERSRGGLAQQFSNLI